MVSNYLGTVFPAGVERRWGFPWTTRTVLELVTTGSLHPHAQRDPVIAQMALPEPSAAVQLAAGAIARAVIGAFRAVTRR
jgi:hypothetical protein